MPHTNFIVGKYNSGWTYPAVGTRTATTTEATGLTVFSDFAIGEPLPPAPDCAGIVSPLNAATGVSVAATLNWSAPAGGGPVTGYKLYFGTNNPPTDSVNGTNLGNVLTYDPPFLQVSTTYYGKIVPTGGGGDAVGCPIWSFTTGIWGITTAGSGNWSSTTPNQPWPGGILPAPGDNVLIADTCVITLDMNATVAGLTVGQGVSGTLQTSKTVLTNLIINGNLTVNTGASFKAQAQLRGSLRRRGSTCPTRFAAPAS